MSDQDQTARVDQLLTEHHGNRKAVATAMGWTAAKLCSVIFESPDLRFKWSTSHDVGRKMLSAAKTISRKSSAIPPSDLEKAVAVQEEDDKFRNGLAGLNLPEEEFEYAAKLQKLHRHHFVGIGDMIHGGMAHASIKVMMKINELSDRLKQGFAGEDPLSEERMCWESFHRACENLIKFSEAAQNGALIRARIEVLKKQTQEGARSRGKPGFAPQTAPAINLQINTGEKKVEVNQV